MLEPLDRDQVPEQLESEGQRGRDEQRDRPRHGWPPVNGTARASDVAGRCRTASPAMTPTSAAASIAVPRGRKGVSASVAPTATTAATFAFTEPRRVETVEPLGPGRDVLQALALLSPRERANEGREVPGHVDGDPRSPEARAPGLVVVSREACGRRFVERDLGGEEEAPAPEGPEKGGEEGAVRRVADPDEGRGCDRRHRGAPRRHDADERELGRASEHHEAQGACLPHLEPGGHRERSETDPVHARRDPYRDALAPCLGLAHGDMLARPRVRRRTARLG